MRAKYITIEQEYGSGGRIIATQLAEECCLPCFGREILEKIAKYSSLGIDGCVAVLKPLMVNE